jgi:hypothetical protein
MSFLVTDKDVRQVPKFETPKERQESQETLIVDPRVIQSGNTLANKVQIKYESEPHGSLARMQEKGLRITSYTETDGAGRPITNRRWKDNDGGDD